MGLQRIRHDSAIELNRWVYTHTAAHTLEAKLPNGMKLGLKSDGYGFESYLFHCRGLPFSLLSSFVSVKIIHSVWLDIL